MQDQGAAPGPAPVTAEELEAIMKAGPQGKPRRKKQKTEAASAADDQAAGNAAAASAVKSHHQQQQQQLTGAVTDRPARAGQPAAALGAGQFVRPADRESGSAALARGPLQTGNRQIPEPPADLHALEAAHLARVQLNIGDQQAQAAAAASPADTASAMPPPRASGQAGPGPSGAAPAGWAQANPAATQHAAEGGYPYSHPAAQPGRPLARPAESQGGSMASDSAWGTEEERMQRKLQRQAEKQRMK